MFTIQITRLQQMDKTAQCPAMTLKSNLVKAICFWSFWLGLGYLNSLATLPGFRIMWGGIYEWWHLLQNKTYSAVTLKTAPGVQESVHAYTNTWYETALQEIHGHLPLPLSTAPILVDIYLLTITLRLSFWNRSTFPLILLFQSTSSMKQCRYSSSLKYYPLPP